MDVTQIEEFVRKAYIGSNRGPGGSRVADVLIQPYFYPVVFLNVTPGQAQEQFLQLSSNSDFVLCGIYSTGETADATHPTPKITLQIEDTGSDQKFWQGVADCAVVSSIYGYADLSFPYPRIINGRSALKINIQSYAVAAVYRRYAMSLSGVMVQCLN